MQPSTERFTTKLQSLQPSDCHAASPAVPCTTPAQQLRATPASHVTIVWLCLYLQLPTTGEKHTMSSAKFTLGQTLIIVVGGM
jgi:hypothetical protein